MPRTIDPTVYDSDEINQKKIISCLNLLCEISRGEDKLNEDIFALGIVLELTTTEADAIKTAYYALVEDN